MHPHQVEYNLTSVRIEVKEGSESISARNADSRFTNTTYRRAGSSEAGPKESLLVQPKPQ